MKALVLASAAALALSSGAWAVDAITLVRISATRTVDLTADQGESAQTARSRERARAGQGRLAVHRCAQHQDHHGGGRGHPARSGCESGEKASIESKAKQVQGVTKISNQLEVAAK